MQLVVLGDAKVALLRPDPAPRRRVEVRDHIGSQVRVVARVDGLVHHLEHEHAAVVAVGVDPLRHPLEELVGPLVVVGRVEAGIIDTLVV